ncbi:MAG: aminopeptidase [Cytophagales bacterium]|nr:aminopeptidase [Cytophagales bacterium]
MLLFLAIVFNWSLLLYGWGQLQGQVRILQGAQPIEEVLNDPQFADSLKPKLHLIQEIKAFAEDSLGINPSNNYTSVYDQKGKPILWIVTACEPFELNDYKWSFPVLGDLSYKGFFEKEKAEQEKKRLESLYDAEIGEVTAWSTLGWFDDPVLTGFLGRSEGDLANLIIHELTHGTLYIKGDVTYNENLASFIGDVGAKRFLIQKYGRDSKEYLNYVQKMEDREVFTQFVLQKADSLEGLYQSWEGNSVEVKKSKKEQALKTITNEMQSLPLKVLKYPKRISNLKNTFFMSYRRYHVDIHVFEKEFKEKYNSNFDAYFKALKEKYGN